MFKKRKFVLKTAAPAKKAKTLTRFKDLPDEIILLICRYLSPAHVLDAFRYYNKRLSSCISEYRQNIDLTKCSYADLKFLLAKLIKKDLRPSKLTVSNARMPKQVDIFLERLGLEIWFRPKHLNHLSLLKCVENNFRQISLCLEKCKSLRSLHIVQSTSEESRSLMTYLISEKFYRSIFNSFRMLTELELTTNDGIILDKQLRPNEHLKSLIISLQNINDLYILLDGLAPNLNLLHVIICQPKICKRSSLPRSWPNHCMRHLMELQLIVRENVPFTFDQLHSTVMPLVHLEKLTLIVNQWISDNQQFMEGHQLEMLIHQFMPQLHDFYCSIKTINDINMQTFVTLNQRWPMKCHSESNNTYQHLYTVPWPFEKLHISMLAHDDTTSTCPAVRSLTVDMTTTDISHRFPKLHTLTILPGCNLSQNDYLGFRRLRRLTITSIDVVPSSVIRRIHTLTLLKIDELLNHPIIYSNLKDLTVKDNPVGSSALITALVKHFPNLHSLSLQLQSNGDYYDNLDVLLDDEHLPYLSLLKTNRPDELTYCPNVDRWIAAKTRLKWRSTPFLGHIDGKDLTICL